MLHINISKMIRKEKLIRFISKGYDKEMKKLLFNFSFNLFCWKINIPFMYIISLEQQCVLYEIVFSTQFINFELITTRDSSGKLPEVMFSLDREMVVGTKHI